MSKPSFYNLAWRWHFYAGLFVIPFMILLSLTGIVYLFKPQLDPLMYPELLSVQPAGTPLSADQQLARLQQVLPQAEVSQYLPPATAESSAQFVAQLDGRKTNLFLDPYSGALLGQQDAANNLQALARALHGELLIGTVGDRLIELADDKGVFTVALFADDPRHDATLHLDQYSGQVLADIRWADYGLVARAVESGAMLHEGKMFGLANQLLMLLACLLILLASVSGLVMWWKRRPQGRFGVPPLRHDLPLWKGGVAIMFRLGLLFPLVGASLLLMLVLDWLGQRLTRRGAEAVAG